MRLCIFTPHAPADVGGAERATDGLARHLYELGVDVTLLAPRGAASFKADYRIKEYDLTSWRRRLPELLVSPLLLEHKQTPFDLIVSLYGYPTGYAAVRAGIKARVPVVIISQGGDIYENAGVRSKILRWKRNVFAYRHADALVSISPYVEDLLKSIVAQPKMMEYIPNGIEIDEFDVKATRPSDFTDARPFVLCLGNLRAVKGFQYAIDAFGQIKQEGFEAPAPPGTAMVVVGSGEMEQSLKAQVEKLGLGKDVIFMGRRMGNDKAWFVQNCEFGLMPSLEEAHAIVGLEFLCAGKPVIASTCAAFDRTFDHGVNSLRVPLKDSRAIAKAMRELTRMGPANLKSACRLSAEAFDWRVLGPRYVKFFEQVVQDYRKSN